jgi:prophage DNA circulation protein
VSPPQRQSAAAAAADRVRAVLEAAEQSAAELRAEAAEEIEGQLARAQAVAERLSGRADEIEKALQGLADSVRDELSALKADLEELRAVKEGIGSVSAEAAATAPVLENAVPAEPEKAAPAEAAPAEAAPAEPEEAAPAEAAPAEPEEAAPAEAAPAPAATGAGVEGARVIALNMALNGSSREETAHYLSENFQLEDPEALLDEVYARVSG